jgi:hypothetical protein
MTVPAGTVSAGAIPTQPRAADDGVGRDPLPTYAFDHASSSYRPREDAEKQARVLLARLALPAGQAKAAEACKDLFQLLVRFAAEIPLNVVWYEQKLKWGLGVQRWSVPFVIAFGVALLGLTGFVGLGGSAADQTFNATRIAVMVAVAFGTLQMVATALDYKARIGGFWQAMSDLKELLFTFEETMRGKPLVDTAKEPTPTPEALLALWQALRAARKISRDERTNYFATFRSPTDVLQAAASAIDVVRGKRADETAAVKQLQAPADALSARIDQLRGNVLDARAAASAAASKATAVSELIKDKKATAAQESEAALAAVAANAEVVRAETALAEVMRAASRA